MAEVSQLSEREREILKLVATGATNQQIAGELGISINTVKVHLRNIFAKIGTASRTEATLYAVRSGLVEMAKTAQTGEVSIAVPDKQSLKPEVPDRAERKRGLSRSVIAIIGTVGGLGLALVLIWLLGFRLPNSGQPAAPTAVSQQSSGPTATASWTAQRDLPIGLGGAAGSSVDGQIYLIGGRSSAGVSAQTWRYDPRSNTWAALPNKSTATQSIQAVVLGGKIYVPGGELADGSISAALEVYDPVNQTWQQKARLPQPRSAYGLAAVDGRLYLFGGWDGTQARGETFVYDPANDRWQEQQLMPTARAYCAAVAVDGKIYVLGGEAQGAALSANEQFTPVLGGQGTWQKVTPLERPRARFGVSAVTNNIVVVGGAAGEDPARYDVRSATWQSLKPPALPLGAQPVVVARDSSVFIATGDPSKPASAFYELRLLYTVTITLP